MDAVKSFNAELSSLYEVKPPISKAKMTALTRGAIKAIKFYKHVVQSVEKFILKCKPEYKIPGLYVIDSIVRQSRHQFGADKDVFAPRFAKNMQQTFANLYRCPSEDKSKIIRVLNLWQKNQVFAPEVIQPLFDLADPNHPIHREPPPGSQASGIPAANGVNTSLLNNVVKNSPAARTPTRIDSNTSNSLLNASGVDVNMLAQLQQLQQIIFRQQQSNSTPQSNTATSQVNATGQPVRFDRKLLDFDYGSEDEDDKNTSPINQTTHSANNTQQSNNIATGIESLKNNISVFSILSNPEVLRQLQTLQQLQVGGQQQMNQSLQQQFASQQLDLQEKMRKLKEMKQQEEEFDKHLAQTKLPFAAECDLKPIATQQTYKHEPAYILPSNFDMTQPPPGYSSNQPVIQSTMPPYNPQLEGSPLLDEVNNESEIEFVDENNTNNGDVEVINLDQTDSQSPQSSRSIDDRYDRRRRRGSRSRSRDRSRRSRSRDRRRRSRSRSRSRRNRRSRSPRDRDRDREKDKDREKEREKDRERRKRGLPSIKKDHLSVCTTTLWVGHLSKLVHAEELSDTFGEFGDIVSIDLIPPRGCAFIVMNRRQDAARCLSKLRNHKMQGKAITLAWAPGKGVKGKDWKDYWEVELGVSYIPWSKLKPTTDLELLEEGGMIDEDTMPQWMKQKLEQQREMKQNQPLAQQNTEIQLPPLAVTALPNLVPLQTATAGDTNAATGFLSLPETITTVPPPTSSASGKPPPTVVTNVDTTQPPPPQTLQPAGPPGMLQPMALPLVPPFPQLNPRLLGPTMPGMIPPGMIPPNVPIGVPPPNLQPGLLPNSMLSFGQSVLPPPPHLGQLQLPPNTTAAGLTDKPPVPGIPLPSDGTSMSSQETSLLGPGPFSSQIQTVITSQRSQSQGSITGTGQHDDMDIEMEDAEHKDKNVSGNQQSLSDELLASIGKGSGFPQSNQRRDIDERQSLPPHLSFGDLDERRSNSRQHDNRHDRTRDSRDRGSDRNDRNHRDSRDRGGRDRDRDGRRDRDKSRWSDRDRRSDRDDRDKRQLSNRVEKTLSERLQEMANESSRDDSYDNSYSRRGDDRPPKSLHNCGPNNPPSLLDLPTVRPNLLDNPSGPSDSFPPYHRSTSPDSDRNHHERDAGDYDIRMRNTRAPNRILESEFGPNFDSHGGPRHLLHLNDMERIDCDRFEFDSHRESFDRRDPNYSHPEERRLMDDMYDHRNRGGPPHDFFTPNREGFNMRGPPGVPAMIRGGPPGGPDFGPRGPDFCPRGPDFGPRGPMMGGPRGPMPPHLFHPRGMGPMGHRGPRMGPWMDGPPRPNFQPRFVNSDGPPDQFFNSGPNRSFEESPMRGPRRDDNRRRHISEDRITDEDRENNRNRDRRSRWSNISPNKHDESKSEQMYDTQNDIDESNDDRKEKMESKFISDLPFVKKDTNEVDQKFKNDLKSENENQMDIDEEKSNIKSTHTTQADIKNIQSPKSDTKNIHGLKSDQNNSDVKSEQDKIQLFCKSSDSNDHERDDYKDFKMENKADITPVDGGATPLRDEQHEENNRDNCKLDKNVEGSETENISTEA